MEQRVQTNRYINSLASLPLFTLIHPLRLRWWNVSDESNFATLYSHIIEGHQKISSLFQVACVAGILKGREREWGAWEMGGTFPLPCTPFALLMSLKSLCPSLRIACHAGYLGLQSFNNSKLVVTLCFLKTQ